MLSIIEGSNYVGKTSTIEELKKICKKDIFVYHPRFNDSKHYDFNYKIKFSMFEERIIDSKIHVPRDVVYQISHTVCLKYIESFKEKKVFLDRCFLSEMVYNEYADIDFYETLVESLKKNFDYKIYFLTCDDDEELRNRIDKRLKDDMGKKGFGIRVGNESDPETIEEKFNSQKMINKRYLDFIEKYDLNHLKIDTSHIPQKEVAKIIKRGI